MSWTLGAGRRRRRPGRRSYSFSSKITIIVLITPGISRRVVVLGTLPLLVIILVVHVPLIALLLVIIVG
jgi:hypothetical protein